MLYLIRHGRPIRDDIFLGQIDEPLSDQQQSLDISTVNNPDAIILSSPLVRAIQTAQLLGHSQPNIDYRLAEIDLGEYAGQPKQSEYRDLVQYLDIDRDFDAHGGETTTEFLDRVGEVLAELMELATDTDVMVFTHSGVIRAMLTILTGRNTTNYVPNYLETICYDPSTGSIRKQPANTWVHISGRRNINDMT